MGHFALGYLLSRTASKLTKGEINPSLVLTLSVIPDVDMIIPFLEHRGPAHSILIILAVFMPIFTIYHKKAIPYFLAVAQHSLIGDFTVGNRAQLLWPLSKQYYGIGINMQSLTNIAVEWTIYAASMIMMLKTKDVIKLFKPHSGNLILAIPTFTVLLPAFLGIPINVASQLIIPHITYMQLFAASLILEIIVICNASKRRS